ncbi:MAG: hypothetical protein II666_00390 [Butyrivibrio sp.]|nr:hypothetical protein [Butyrivibrio sp.]
MKCDKCGNLEYISNDKSTDSKKYLECANYVKELVQSGDFIQRNDISPYCKTTDLNDTKQVKGWSSDLMQYRIECTKCGRVFELFADTYHGSWGFYISK